MPRHIKRLYSQRNLNNTYNQNFQKSIILNSSGNVSQSSNALYYNSINKIGIVEDTNNKLVELNKILE